MIRVWSFHKDQYLAALLASGIEMEETSAGSSKHDDHQEKKSDLGTNGLPIVHMP